MPFHTHYPPLLPIAIGMGSCKKCSINIMKKLFRINFLRNCSNNKALAPSHSKKKDSHLYFLCLPKAQVIPTQKGRAFFSPHIMVHFVQSINCENPLFFKLNLNCKSKYRLNLY